VGNWHDVSRHARSLSGLGPGLTPAGDDALTGLVLGLLAAVGTLPTELRDAISEAVAGRTTELAEARVRHALAGRADEVVYRLLTGLVTGPGDDLTESVTDLVAFGHSSGADTLVGIVVGMRMAIRL
jgi:hypothetical protein